MSSWNPTNLWGRFRANCQLLISAIWSFCRSSLSPDCKRRRLQSWRVFSTVYSLRGTASAAYIPVNIPMCSLIDWIHVLILAKTSSWLIDTSCGCHLHVSSIQNAASCWRSVDAVLTRQYPRSSDRSYQGCTVDPHRLSLDRICGQQWGVHHRTVLQHHRMTIEAYKVTFSQSTADKLWAIRCSHNIGVHWATSSTLKT